MQIEATSSIWMDGEFVAFDEATTHVLTHTLHYGSGAFEGVRAYAVDRGPAPFRLRDHLRRLADSCAVLQIPMPYTVDELYDASLAVIRANDVGRGLYVRPLVYRGFGEMGINPLGAPVHAAIAAWPWGAYMGEEGLRDGIDVVTSSWRRAHPNAVPSAAKATGSYVTSGLAFVEALRAGAHEAILLGPTGEVSEGTGENLFVVRSGTVITPPSSEAGALPGITQDTVCAIARDLGYPVRFESMIRTDLYLADELFLTGTAAEVTPVRSVDQRTVGTGNRGPITAEIQATYFAAVRGEVPHYRHWIDWP
jgi:branched-chain amino acid aminotransferase